MKTTSLDYEITKLSAEDKHRFIHLVVSNSALTGKNGNVASIGGFDTREEWVVGLLKKLLRIQ